MPGPGGATHRQDGLHPTGRVPCSSTLEMCTMRCMPSVDTGDAGSAALRRAGPDDARAVADVLIRSRQAAVGAIPAAVHSDDEIREWIKAVVIPEREVWLVVSSTGQALALLVLDDGWVDHLYVDPDWTGMGLGSRLIELAKARRPAGLQLWTFATNVRAQRFYGRHGFVVAETTDGSGNEEQEPDLRFVWPGP
jgi:GNAT superfamily N-acetyltransferase